MSAHALSQPFPDSWERGKGRRARRVKLGGKETCSPYVGT